VHGPDGRRIAVSDYGPSSGRPVLVVHSSTTSRPVARGLLRALQDAGYRPLAIDRPGFGLTDEVRGLRPGVDDPYGAAAGDALRVLDRLRLERVDVVARGGAKAVLALEAAAPGRLGRVVLVNPDPHVGARGRGSGIFAALKQLGRRNPAVMRLSIALLARQTSYARLDEFLRRAFRGSPPDERALQDPELVRDFFRAVRTLATGRYQGVVNEQVDFAYGRPLARLAGTTDWRVLVAAHDTMHDPQQVLEVWRAILPDARFRRVEDAGRLLALSHPQHVVEALTEP
jgi:pimeloyl-ACP methyl ester carboxylesterase